MITTASPEPMLVHTSGHALGQTCGLSPIHPSFFFLWPWFPHPSPHAVVVRGRTRWDDRALPSSWISLFKSSVA